MTIDVLEKALLGSDSVKSVVGFTKSPKVATEGDGFVFAGWDALFVHLGNAELNRGVIVWWDEAVSSVALTWDKHIDDIASFVLHTRKGQPKPLLTIFSFQKVLLI